MYWLPIETAPKDGTEILVFNSEGIYLVAWLDDSISRSSKSMCWCVPMSWQDEQGGHHTVQEPTHWMPLPNSPECDDDEKKLLMTDVKLLPCPFCGMEPEDDLIDTLYRSGILWRDHPHPDGSTMRSYHGRDTAKEGDGWCWTMHCTQNQGGCGAEIGGDSREEAIARWNTRVGQDTNG